MAKSRYNSGYSDRGLYRNGYEYREPVDEGGSNTSAKSRVRLSNARQSLTIDTGTPYAIRLDPFTSAIYRRPQTVLELMSRTDGRKIRKAARSAAQTKNGMANSVPNRSPSKNPLYETGWVQIGDSPSIATDRKAKEAAVCVRRQRRKETLFALKKAGRGGMKKPRHNATSKIKC